MMSAGVRLIYTTVLVSNKNLEEIKCAYKEVGMKFDGGIGFAKFILDKLERNKR